jgi:hypothetical protein
MTHCLFIFIDEQRELRMKKSIAVIMSVLAICVLLGGCYAKSCDTTCPSVKYHAGK